jgi:hypothetical protein
MPLAKLSANPPKSTQSGNSPYPSNHYTATKNYDFYYESLKTGAGCQAGEKSTLGRRAAGRRSARRVLGRASGTVKIRA